MLWNIMLLLIKGLLCLDSLHPTGYADVLVPLHTLSHFALKEMFGEEFDQVQLVNFSESWKGPRTTLPITKRYNQIE